MPIHRHEDPASPKRDSSLSSMSLAIRKATEADTDALFRICLLTADAGKSASALHDFPELPGLTTAVPYLTREATWAYVLEEEDTKEVVGYVVGAYDTRAYEEDVFNNWFPVHAIRYRYGSPLDNPNLKPRDRHYLETYRNPETRRYCDANVAFSPAHAHINILEKHQGKGWGRKLIGTAVNRLREMGLDGLWVRVNATNHEARRFYLKLGFQVIPDAPDTNQLGLKFADFSQSQSTCPQSGVLQEPGYMANPALPSQQLPSPEDGIIVVGDFQYTEYPKEASHLYPQIGYNNLLHHQRLQILSWGGKTGNKVLVREFHAKYKTDGEAKRISRENIDETLTGFLGQGTSFEISDPKVDPLASRNRTDPPWHSLIYNLSDADFIKLLAHPIIATPKCVLIISPFDQVIPTFITSITGLTCKGTTLAGQKIATEAVRIGISSDPSLISDFDQLAGNGAFRKLVEGLHVYFVNSSSTHPNSGWWNAESYGMPRNISIEIYQALMTRIRSLRFPTDDFGDGTALTRTRECMNCKCISHPVALCPLYDMKGWLGPTKADPENRSRNNAPQQNTGGRPVRDRGSHKRRV